MRQGRQTLLAGLALVIGAGVATGQDGTQVPMRQDELLNLRMDGLGENGAPPPMRAQLDTDLREIRNYPEQPPLIPHAIEGYQVRRASNKCLTCHARARTGESQAPMVSVTHYSDRHGQVLASVSPRRYFCTQCHVPQYPDAPLVENSFVDIDTLLSLESGQPDR